MSSTPTSTGRTAGRPGAASRAAGWVAPLCWIAVLLDGFDLVVVGTVIPTLRTPEEWALSGSGATAVITIGLVGMMIGALTIGTLTDLVGRRKALIGAVASFSLFTLLCAVAPNATIFGLLRFLAGLGLGGCLPTAIAMVNEFTRAGRSGRATTTIMTGYHVGAVATAALAIVVVDSIGWRWRFVIGALPALVLVPLMLRHLPESAAYLLAHGRRAEAEEVARRHGLQLESAPPPRTPARRAPPVPPPRCARCSPPAGCATPWRSA
jgi:AAHS family benzoate transporter-like MFS transporter